MMLGLFEAQRGNDASAVIAFRKDATRRSDDAFAPYYLGLSFEAINQYEKMVVYEPSNLDVLRDWGKLVLRDKSQDIQVRKKEATRIWNQIIAIRPNDASTVSQVADFFRQSSLNDEAIALYQKAVELAPNEPQYREYLGEFLHIQKRTDEAFLVWKEIAEGSRRNAGNMARLAEVYKSFGFHTEAVSAIVLACQMDPKDFRLVIRCAELHMRSGQFDESLDSVVAAENDSSAARSTRSVSTQRCLWQSNVTLTTASIERGRKRSVRRSEVKNQG